MLNITATTSDEQIEDAIRFLDMQSHALEMRDMARAVIAEQGDQIVLELHEFGDVVVLWSPVFGHAYVNEHSSGVGNSLTIESGECPSPEHAAKVWKGEV